MRILHFVFMSVMTVVLLQITCASLYEEGPVNINEELAQEGCTSCHKYPPDSGEHDHHLIKEGKECFDCHFYTVERDTFMFETDTGMIYRFTNMKMKITDDDDTIPIIITDAHITNKVDVVLKRRVEDSVNRQLIPEETIWNNCEKSCSKLSNCHSPLDVSHYEKELWYRF